MKFRTKLILTYFLIAAVPSILIFVPNYLVVKQSFINSQKASLEAITDLKVAAIENYFAEFKKDAAIIQEYFNIKINLPILDKYKNDPENQKYLAAIKMLDGQLSAWPKNRQNVLNIVLFNSQGEYLYSVNPNRWKAEHANGLYLLYKDVLDKGKTEIYAGEIYVKKMSTDDAPFKFLISAPIYDFDNKFAGLVAIEVDSADIFGIVEDTRGLGNTGETLLGKLQGNTIVFLNPLRYDSQAALKRTITIGEETGIPIQLAVENKNGSGATLDYRGKKVLAAWRYVPSKDWGLVAKIDIAEILAPIYTLTFIFILIIFICISLMGFLIRFFSRRNSEAFIDLQKFKLACNNASDHIIITDTDGIVLYANRVAEKITGYSIKEILGKKAGKLWGGLMPKEYYAKMWDTIKNKKKDFDSEIINRRKNGEKYEASIDVAPILDEKGNVVFFVGLERDISKEKSIDRAKTEFVSLASHQLRTPLTAIKWYGEMLMQKNLKNKDRLSYTKQIYSSNERMIALINALLNVSRIEMGIFTIESKKASIVLIAKDVISELSPAMKKKKLRFTEEYGKDIGLLPLDSQLIHIVIQNVLNNAIKYSRPKGLINFSIKKDGKNILITTRDFGIGIPKDQQDKIFQKLFRADNVRQMDSDGTGLGLYIVKTIVDSSGCKISFDSKEGKGSVFIVQIPLSGMKNKKGEKTLEHLA